ncbi:hypothetical protein HPP92_010243 [Vanilla planifolia]|uniref:Oberon-like PHD finger domain-containing protein n=1 Tax=Vanilla planifolia TaxID=51239 RepID=A0A835R4S5_VANPL|nr:hypothetical protein HPP92_010243 [Vanilla planifolia]
MDSRFSGYVLGLSNPQFSIREKRDIVWQLAEGSNTAHEKLQTWSRRDLLEVLCSELGKEKKYTGLTKQKLIENIFKIVSAKKAGKHSDGAYSTPTTLTAEPQTTIKRQRKNGHPSCFPISVNIFTVNDQNEAPKKPSSCPNVACRATLSQEVPFCRRCSCCICHKYDENKDPSLWLFCSSEDLSQSESCGLSCHIYCALKDERTGLVNYGKCSRLDGSFCCIYCAKMNSLQGCWRKQLAIAKDARRIDVLCHRVSLCHKILGATQKYQKLNEIVDNALRKLESEVGPLNDDPNVGRGIVNRLSVGAEVQRLCAQAVEVLDNMLSSTQSVNVQLKTNSDLFGLSNLRRCHHPQLLWFWILITFNRFCLKN